MYLAGAVAPEHSVQRWRDGFGEGEEVEEEEGQDESGFHFRGKVWDGWIDVKVNAFLVRSRSLVVRMCIV